MEDTTRLPDDGAARPGRISIGAVLALLIAAVMLPAMIFAVVLLQRTNQAQQAMLTTLAEATAGSISETTDRQINGMITTLRVLSALGAVDRDDIADFHNRASSALDGASAYLIVTDAEYNQLINTRVPFGTPLGPVTDQESARAALSSGQPIVSNAFFGRTAQRWVYNVAMPLTRTQGRMRLLILTQDAETLSSLLASQNLRGGWNVAVVDRLGTVLASSFMSADIGKPFFLNVGQNAASGTTRETVSVEGEDYETIRSVSALSGWQVIVWAPSAVTQQPLVRSMRLLAIGGLAIIAIGLILAWVLGRQIARPIRRLARDARHLGAGQNVEAIDYAVSEIATVSQALAQASRDRQTAENEIRFLMREVAHRSKNQLTVVSSIAKQTARYARSFAGFQDAFQKRVHGLARSTDLLIAGGVAGVELRELVEAQIEPFAPSDGARVEITGPSFRLSNQAAQTLGLALHELSTNASKYGAFATTQGNLAVSWEVDDHNLHLAWREKVPRLRRRNPATRGFGTEVIERMLGGALGATIERTLHVNGLECRFALPLEGLRASTNEDDAAEAG